MHNIGDFRRYDDGDIIADFEREIWSYAIATISAYNHGPDRHGPISVAGWCAH